MPPEIIRTAAKLYHTVYPYKNFYKLSMHSEDSKGFTELAKQLHEKTDFLKPFETKK